MTINCSTFFRTSILGPQSFNDILGGGVIRVFSGPQPTNADQAEQGTLLGLITLNGQSWTPGNPAWGITYSVSGVAAVPSSNVPLILTTTQSGTAGWFRIVGNAADNTQQSLLLPRIDGSIGNGSAPSDMVWASTTLTAGVAYQLDTLMFVLPPI
jgi:hypothetical protein